MAKKKRGRRPLFILLGLLVVVVVLALVAARFLGDRTDGETVETARAEVRTITQVVTSSGRVQPEVEIVISPDVSGEIIQLPVIEGQQVRRGELLARIKPDFYTAQVEQAEANVSQGRALEAQRRADLLNAKQELDRQKSLFDRQVVAESVYQQALTQHEIAKAAMEAAQFSVESAEARLRESKEQLSKTVLYAPMDGTISQLDIELGERVVGTTQMAGTPMMIIARLDQMELDVDVNENDVVNVSLGDTAAIEIDAYPERIFKGLVTEIANSARVVGSGTQEQVTNFPVKIRILDPHNPEARLAAGTGTALEEESPVSEAYPSFRPGMSGTVDIFTMTVGEVVAVPIQAVTVRDFNQLRADEENRRRRQGEDPDTTEAAAPDDQEQVPESLREEDLRKVVFLMDDENKARIVEVETGIADDRYIEVKLGLDGGERVITGPYRAVSRTLRPDMDVQERSSRGRGRRGGPPGDS